MLNDHVKRSLKFTMYTDTIKTLIGRIQDYWASDNISILNFLLNTKFVKDAHRKKNCYILGTDGLVNSVHNLVNVNYDVHKRDIVIMLLTSF